MISHKHEFIFIHIPKTAGSGIEKVLLNNEGISKFTGLIHLSRNQKANYLVSGLGVNHHWPLSKFKEEYQKKYFCFTFVRNPWDILVSEFNWLKVTDKIKQKSKYVGNNFKDFLTNDLRTAMWHKIPCCDFINDNIDFIGRFENLQEDFNVVCDKIGIPRQELPYYNKTKHKHYTEYYNDDTRQIVAEKYKKDIEMFGYEFGD